jgi:hypothetical protein
MLAKAFERTESIQRTETLPSGEPQGTSTDLAYGLGSNAAYLVVRASFSSARTYGLLII